jgi:NADH-quinone oxidoreductase subunit H
MTEWLQSLDPFWLAVIRVALLLLPILILVPGLIWWERRLLSWMQDRIGPNRIPTMTNAKGKKYRAAGLVQTLFDGLKLFLKEDITPASVDRKVYFFAPALALFPAFVLGGTMPFGPQSGIWALLTPVADIEIGLMFVLAISSLGVYGVVLAGYASNNKYSLMGGLRASAQLISYELAMGVSLLAIVFAAGSLKMTKLVEMQEGDLLGVVPAMQNWFIFTPYGFVAGVIFLICMVAESNRAPFDLPEAENELIAGYHTEYSSMKFAVFFMGEYAAMFIFSGIFACVFLGGYNIAPLDWAYLAENASFGRGFFAFMVDANYWLAPAVFLGKCTFGITFYIWLRATLPRLRYDQLMSLGWKTLLPIAVFNFCLVGLWLIVQELRSITTAWITYAIAAGLIVAIWMGVKNRMPNKLERRTVTLVDPKRAS